ncbi:hypothetical protein BC832DRAFT_535737 [Gaertneriomyces semiglobifer]|nr:hypothetical protein BC832DRAFT_535737 [Gaertneriomyces semiglobifer]
MTGGSGANGNRWAAAAQAAQRSSDTGFSGGSNGAYRSWENVEEEPEDWDNSDWLQRKTKKVQNDSLLSTRRALSRLNESDALARSNLERLNLQSEQLSRVNSRLESADEHINVSDAKADHLTSLNRWFFLPSFGGKKVRNKEEAALKDNEQRKTRDSTREEEERNERNARFQDIQSRKFESSSRGMYTTPDGIERDTTEEEIDNNLDLMSAGIARLKLMSQTMNSELGAQNTRIHSITDRSMRSKERIDRTNTKVTRIAGK